MRNMQKAIGNTKIWRFQLFCNSLFFKYLAKTSVVSSVVLMMGIAGCSAPVRQVSTLNMLAGLGRDDKLKQQAVDLETVNFKRVKRSIETGRIEPGISKRAAISRFGQPILVFSEEEPERWAYKPANAGWVGGEKIYLYFDAQGNLSKWEYIEADSKP